MALANRNPGELKHLQESLNLLGFSPGRFDGVVDDGVLNAIRRFQESRGMAFTGDVDDALWGTISAQGDERRADPVFSDPKYLAFMRMSGVQDANIRNEIQARIDQANRETNRAAAGYETKKKEQTRNIGLDFEDRGLNLSGRRISSQAEASANVDYDRQMEEAARADALANANRKAEQDLARIAQDRAEEEIGARNRLAEKRGTQVYQAGA